MCKIGGKSNFNGGLSFERTTNKQTQNNASFNAKRYTKRNALLVVLQISMNCIPNYSFADTNITDYIQSSYGSGNSVLNFNINNQTIKYNYKNQYGIGSALYNYMADTHGGQQVNINVNYTSAQTEKIINTKT